MEEIKGVYFDSKNLTFVFSFKSTKVFSIRLDSKNNLNLTDFYNIVSLVKTGESFYCKNKAEEVILTAIYKAMPKDFPKQIVCKYALVYVYIGWATDKPYIHKVHRYRTWFMAYLEKTWVEWTAESSWLGSFELKVIPLECDHVK